MPKISSTCPYNRWSDPIWIKPRKLVPERLLVSARLRRCRRLMKTLCRDGKIEKVTLIQIAFPAWWNTGKGR